ncbi:MAG TPA: DUF4129 domain-containing protein [Mycobacterium sp.]|nr:DUF4129 domain-containing protein [Mycobacterium sp.]
MPGMDKAAGRVAALMVLLMLAAAALHGYLPAAARPPRTRAAGSPAMLAPVAVLLGVSLAIVAVAFITRVRHRRLTASSFAALPTGPGGGRGRASWRVLLVSLAVLAAWLPVLWLLTKWVGQQGHDPRARAPGPVTNAPATSRPAPVAGTPRPDWLQQQPGGDAFGYLAAAAVVMLVLIIAGTALTAGARRKGLAPPGLPDVRLRPAGTAAGPEALVRATELGLAEVDNPGREPREAIIGCYAVMEGELARVPEAAPQDCDTPTEVLARAVEHHALPAANAAQLVNLFTEARFSPHLMTEAHRQDAIRILRLVLTELRSRV